MDEDDDENYIGRVTEDEEFRDMCWKQSLERSTEILLLWTA